MSLLEERIVDSRPESKRKLEEVSQMSLLMPRKETKHICNIVPGDLTIDASATHKAALAEEIGQLKSSSSTDSILSELLAGDKEEQGCDAACTSNTKVIENSRSPVGGRDRSSKKRQVRFTDSPTSVTVYIEGSNLSEDEEEDSDMSECVAGLDEEMGDVENVCTKVVVDPWEKIDSGDNSNLRKQLEVVRALLRKFS